MNHVTWVEVVEYVVGAAPINARLLSAKAWPDAPPVNLNVDDTGQVYPRLSCFQDLESDDLARARARWGSDGAVVDAKNEI